MNPSPRTKLYNILKPLTKQEILRLSRTMCEHGHPVLSHTACLEKALGFQERIGHLDLETSSLNANYGMVITYCIKVNGEDTIYEGWLQEDDFKDKAGYYDKRIIQQCVKDMENFDRLIVYWGKDRRHDIPFLRTRALMMDVPFPFYHEQIVTDLYDLVKNKLRLGRNGLQSACNAFGIESKEHPITSDVWMKATVGHDPESIAYILEHNREDVRSTDELWKRMNVFGSGAKTSI